MSLSSAPFWHANGTSDGACAEPQLGVNLTLTSIASTPCLP
jgi:hypothetical protein